MDVPRPNEDVWIEGVDTFKAVEIYARGAGGTRCIEPSPYIQRIAWLRNWQSHTAARHVFIAGAP